MTSSEEWRPVAGYAGAYEVSSLGRVRSLDRWRSSRGKAYLVSGVVLTPNMAGRYPTYTLRKPGHAQKRRAHVLVAAAFIGPRPNGLDVCHNNGNPLDNHAENLRYDTHSANALDMVTHGTHASSGQTECINGHPREGNTTRSGCRACHRARGKRARDAKREAAGKVARADRTECKYGHPLDGANSSQRFCKTCRKAAQDRYRDKRRGAQPKD